MRYEYVLAFGLPSLICIIVLIALNLCRFGIHQEENETIIAGWSGVTLTNLGISNCIRCDIKFLFRHTLGGATGNVRRQRRAISGEVYLEIVELYSGVDGSLTKDRFNELCKLTYDIVNKGDESS